MNRFLYTLLIWLTLPFVPLKLLWRGLKQPDYKKHWGERFGFYEAVADQSTPIICLHCVSVGETRAAAPLIKALQAKYPQYQILITHATPTGREASQQLYGDTILRSYLPYDVPFAVNRFLRHFTPATVLLMETELWFNLIAACKQAEIPIFLINARLSEKSARGYQKISPLVFEGLQNLSVVAAQTTADAQRLSALGAKEIHVCGNLKVDVEIPKEAFLKGEKLRHLLGENRFIFVAASTRDGEEKVIIDALAQLDAPQLLTVIVPRHPQRFSEVATLFSDNHLVFEKKSQLINSVNPQTRFVLGDSMGELFSYYAACDVAFIGGSLLPFGGQNFIEACAMGKATIIGSSTYNFDAISKTAESEGAVLRVNDAEHLVETLKMLMQNDEKRLQMKRASERWMQTMSGATKQTVDLISKYLK